MKPLKLRMSASPRSLTAEKQVLSGRLFLPGELHICAPPTASCSCLSTRVCMCGKAGHRRNAVFLQNIDPGSLWCHAGPQGSPWQVLNTLRWQASASHLLHSSSPKSLWTLTLLVKTEMQANLTGFSERAFAREWVNEQVQSTAYVPSSDLALLMPYSMS